MSSNCNIFNGILGPRRNPFLSKWNVIFEKGNTEWICFKPKLGQIVYPCYACRNMFSVKTSFLDHVNRRTIVLKYKCSPCNNTLTFYNRCSFLLHTREHYSLKEGRINLNDLEVFTLPIGLAGFSPHPNIPMLYIEEEDIVGSEFYINCQFYKPNSSEAGKEVITLLPDDLLFQQGNSERLAMKQICTAIPKCEFVTSSSLQELKKLCFLAEECSDNLQPDVEIKQEPEDTFTMPVISKIESLNKDYAKSVEDYPRCSECNELVKVSMSQHFLNKNIPIDANLNCTVCRYIAPTKCSLKAHIRIHSNLEPYVCPECGKNFEDMPAFRQHLDDVCFHLAKQVRFRCPGKKCGKLFAQTITYASHFQTHLQFYTECSICSEKFVLASEFNLHSARHDQPNTGKQLFNCTVCQIAGRDYQLSNSKQHILWHTNDRSRCLYVYICRFCRSYFRSTGTYAVHLLKCSKVLNRKDNNRVIYHKCQKCGFKICCSPTDVSKECKICHAVNVLHTSQESNQQETDKTETTKVADVVDNVHTVDNDESAGNISCEVLNDEPCILCDQLIFLNDRITHLGTCKYSNPAVVVEKLPAELYEKTIQKYNSSSSEIDSPEGSIMTETNSVKTDSSPTKYEDVTKKRRKRLPFTMRNKKQNTGSEEIEELQAEKPTPFTGTYYCKICSYSNTDRTEFHEHILEHRDISTSYQCMECGECFVVKPSLMKHLQHYHLIEDVDEYVNNNNCFDKMAVKKLEQSTSYKPEFKGPVDENQCRVCLKKFVSHTELNQHFRVHGMAFLMSNWK